MSSWAPTPASLIGASRSLAGRFWPRFCATASSAAFATATLAFFAGRFWPRFRRDGLLVVGGSGGLCDRGLGFVLRSLCPGLLFFVLGGRPLLLLILLRLCERRLLGGGSSFSHINHLRALRRKPWRPHGAKASQQKADGFVRLRFCRAPPPRARRRRRSWEWAAASN